MTTLDSGKAFKKRSVVGTIALVLVILCVLVALAGVGVRFGLPDTWNKGMACAKDVLDTPLLKAFESLSAKYVDEATDLENDEKQTWKERFQKMSVTLREKKGTAGTREKLREVYDGIAGEMGDANLSKAELDPFREKLDLLLEQIETEEAQKKE